MKYLMLILILGLVGCTTHQVLAPRWPEAPLVEPCPALKPLEEPSTLSMVAETVLENYTQYYVCSNTVDTWQLWYEKQKTLYNQALKR
jgi:hypothetical protein